MGFGESSWKTAADVSYDSSCFFFQAEDGIRDKLVTGVQTCALPICHPFHLDPRTLPHRLLCARSRRRRQPFRAFRSEERRVGKECRSRWLTYPEKKNKN